MPPPDAFAADALRRAAQWLLNLLFPKECAGCGSSLPFDNRDYLCDPCARGIFWISPPVCERCGRPLFGSVRPPVVCPRCRAAPPDFDRARAVFAFRDAAQAFVLKYKYAGCPYLALPASRWLKEAGESVLSWEDYDALVPVPLHPRKARERGFNQSELLAAGLSRFCGVPLAQRKLARSRYTKTQTRLDVAERRENMRRAFRVATPGYFRGKSVLLIDDVHTTGATVNECARVLKADGAERVDVLTLARAI